MDNFNYYFDNIHLLGIQGMNKKTIQSIKKACVEVGFFQVIGHGLKNEEIKNICAVGNKFFNMEDK